MKYCIKCLYPNTKPDLWFDEKGVCSACLAFKERDNIDWDVREEEFKALCSFIKDKEFIYDCIVPVSGGKDSHYQIIKALEYGLTPLAITATTDDLSSIGRSNLDNISKLGIDHIEVTTNTKLRRKINKYTLQEVGDISWAEHVTIFTIPIKEALLRSIPLIIWGENSQNEYGGPKKHQVTNVLNSNWLQEFGGLNGLRVQDLVDQNIATLKELHQYRMPPLIEYHKKIGVFLGHFFPWDGMHNAEVASRHGFKRYPELVEGTGVDYENLDNYQTGIHDYFKYLKYGFGRATDIACNKIKRGYITRSEGIDFVEQFDGTFPSHYLGIPASNILGKINVSVEEFKVICDKFTSKQLFNVRLVHSRGPTPKFVVGKGIKEIALA